MSLKAEIMYIKRRFRLWRYKRKIRKFDNDPDGGFFDKE